MSNAFLLAAHVLAPIALSHSGFDSHQAGDSRFFVQQEHDRTLDLNVTMDTLPPMEEAAVDEDLDGPDAKRMRTGIYLP
jgi:hypothetical protein